MPKFGFYVQDLVPWGSSGGKAHTGDDSGCELAIRQEGRKQGKEVYMKSLVAGGLRVASAGASAADANGSCTRGRRRASRRFGRAIFAHFPGQHTGETEEAGTGAAE